MEYGSSVLELPGAVETVDRRKSTGRNRMRRFLNNYWLIPLFVIYFQLYYAIFAIADPVKELVEANLTFAKGISVVKNLLVEDFPFTFKGHLQEVAYMINYKAGKQQIPQEELARLIELKKDEIYKMIISSQSVTYSEVGGMIFIKNGNLSIMPVTGRNANLSKALHQKSSDVEGFLSLISDKENLRIFRKIDINNNLIEKTRAGLGSTLMPKNVKHRIIRNFINLYDSMSEYNYILMPLEFKRFIGRHSNFGGYVGFFHIHNGLYEEPSEVDINRSYEERQIIFTLTNNGFLTYDVTKARQSEFESIIDFDSDYS